MDEKFPKLKKEIDFQVQETQRFLNKMNPRRTRPRHIRLKMVKVKETILKSAREK